MSTPDDPVSQAIQKSRIIIHTVREIDLKFEIPDLLNAFCTLLEVLNRIENQHDMILDILSLGMDSLQAMGRIREKYKSLGEYSIPARSRTDLSPIPLLHCLEFTLKYLVDLKKVLDEARKNDKQQDLVLDLELYTLRLHKCSSYIPLAATVKKTDLFARKKEDPSWDELVEFVKVKKIADPEILEESFEKASKVIKIVYALAKTIENNKDLRSVSNILPLIQYSSSMTKTKKMAQLFMLDPNERVIEIFNLLEVGILKQINSMLFPSIAYCKKIYLESKYPSITQQFIDRTLDREIWRRPELDIFENLVMDLNESKAFDKLQKPAKTKIPVRILSATPLSTQSSSMEGPSEPLEGIIMHIHGGGFVGMSSSSHQLYTREWANLTRKVIISVDYRLAPQNTYPAALDDCWQVYNWLVDNAEKVLGVKPTKIIITGDSVGGNLALSLCLLLIRSKRRIPDGLFLSYPDLNLQLKHYTPSFLEALEDPLFPISFAPILRKSYAGHRYLESDPLVSPILGPNDVLKFLPPTRIAVGERDPLHDDCWRLVDKLRRLQVDVFMTVYKAMHHGYLNMASAKAMPEAHECVKDGAQILLELFALGNNF